MLFDPINMLLRWSLNHVQSKPWGNEKLEAEKAHETEPIPFYRDKENNFFFSMTKKSHPLIAFQFLVPVPMRSSSILLPDISIYLQCYISLGLIWPMASWFLSLPTREACIVAQLDNISWFSNLGNENEWKKHLLPLCRPPLLSLNSVSFG